MYSVDCCYRICAKVFSGTSIQIWLFILQFRAYFFVFILFLAFKSINPESFCSPSGFIDFISRNSFPYSIETDSEKKKSFSESVFFKQRSISSIQQIPCRNKVLSLFP